MDMLMKSKIKMVAHLADVHIRTLRYHDEYLEVFHNLYSSLNEMFDGYDYYECRIVIVGDLFHQKITVSNEQLVLGADFLTELADIAPVIIVAGNHDLLENNLSRTDSISPLISLLKNENIHYYKNSDCFVDSNVTWCNFSIFEEYQTPNIAKYREKNPDNVFIGLFHAPLMGSVTPIGFKFDNAETPNHFAGCDFVMLGDIHLHQEITGAGVRCVYPGSLIQQNFGENISNHGYLLWDLETQTYEMKEVENPYTYAKFIIKSVNDIDDGLKFLVNE
jgi:DNA repair exonuclease SbcCD nuclease subunit